MLPESVNLGLLQRLETELSNSLCKQDMVNLPHFIHDALLDRFEGIQQMLYVSEFVYRQRGNS